MDSSSVPEGVSPPPTIPDSHTSPIAITHDAAEDNATVNEGGAIDVVVDTLENKEDRRTANDDAVTPEVSEQSLRELYDNEEIERFLSLFSAYVTEVRLPDTPSQEPPEFNTVPPPEDIPEEQQDEPDWVSIGSRSADPILNPDPFSHLRSAQWSLSEEIAFRYLLPILPKFAPTPPIFTFGRLRLSAQRLYLSVEPVYVSFFVHLLRLATWKDTRKSSLYCLIFWTLWYQNLLIPALVARILYSLLRRKLFPYPTLSELLRHREEIARADNFGSDITAGFAASSSIGIKEIWRLFRVFKKKGKPTKDKSSSKNEDDRAAEDLRPSTPSNDAVQDEADTRRAILVVMDEIADIHERVKNLFLWRRPAASRFYAMVLFAIFLVTLLLPSQYLAKLTYFVLGTLYWHIVPVIAALPPGARARLPPALGDLPTDADYAMELISQRVAAGLPVKPSSRNSRKSTIVQDLADPASPIADDKDSTREAVSQENGVNWKKWGERTVLGKAWVQDGKRFIRGEQREQELSPPPFQTRGSGMSAMSGKSGMSDARVLLEETHTFPCQHTTAPGIITLSSSTLYFTPLMASDAKVIILLKHIRAVKKTGLLKGISIRWRNPDDPLGVDQEEKFRWVGGRDELFAHLVGSEARQWLRA